VVQLAIPCLMAMVASRVLKAPEISLLALLEVVFGVLPGPGSAPARRPARGARRRRAGAGALVANEVLALREAQPQPAWPDGGPGVRASPCRVPRSARLAWQSN
jgi:hypothetical protein